MGKAVSYPLTGYPVDSCGNRMEEVMLGSGEAAAEFIVRNALNGYGTEITDSGNVTVAKVSVSQENRKAPDSCRNDKMSAADTCEPAGKEISEGENDNE